MGNGLQTNVWEDQWLQKLPRNKLISVCPFPPMKNLKVSDLRGGPSWIICLMRDYISNDEAQAILNSPTVLSNRDDKWCGWGEEQIFTQVGNDEVEVAASSSSRPPMVWNMTWKLKTPYKIKCFM